MLNFPKWSYDRGEIRKTAEKKSKGGLFAKNFNAVHLAAAVALSAAVSAYVWNALRGGKGHEPGESSKPIATQAKRASVGSIRTSVQAAIPVKAESPSALPPDHQKPAAPMLSDKAELESIILGAKYVQANLDLAQARLHLYELQSEKAGEDPQVRQKNLQACSREIERYRKDLQDQNELLKPYGVRLIEHTKELASAVHHNALPKAKNVEKGYAIARNIKSVDARTKKATPVLSSDFLDQLTVSVVPPEGGYVFWQKNASQNTEIHFRYQGREISFLAEAAQSASLMNPAKLQSWVNEFAAQFDREKAQDMNRNAAQQDGEQAIQPEIAKDN